MELNVRLPGSRGAVSVHLKENCTAQEAIERLSEFYRLESAERLTLVVPPSESSAGGLFNSEEVLKNITQCCELWRGVCSVRVGILSSLDALIKGEAAFSGLRHIALDSESSLISLIPTLKNCFSKQLNLGELMFWAVRTDDETLGDELERATPSSLRWLDPSLSLSSQNFLDASSNASECLIIVPISLINDITLANALSLSKLLSTSITKQGWLSKTSQQKQTSKATKQKSRLFLLIGPLLFYFKSGGEKEKSKGCIPLSYFQIRKRIEKKKNQLVIDLENSFPGLIQRAKAYSLFPVDGEGDAERAESEKEKREDVEKWFSLFRLRCFRHSDRCFGVKLENSFNGYGLPKLVVLAIDFFERDEERVKSEGLFRLSASASQLAEKINAFDEGEEIFFPSFCSPHLVAGLFKYYLRSLPEPIIPFSFYGLVVTALAEDSKDAAAPAPLTHEHLFHALSQLPPCSFLLLRSLCNFLHYTAKFHSDNRMDERNLAVVFGSHILRQRPAGGAGADGIGSVPVGGITDVLLSNDIAKILIEQADNLYHVDSTIVTESEAIRSEMIKNEREREKERENSQSVEQKEADKILKEGWLRKKGKEKLSIFKLRFLVLTSKALSYFDDKKNKKGDIVFDKDCLVEIDQEERRRTFFINTKNRVFVFQTETNEELEEWVQAIDRVIDKISGRVKVIKNEYHRLSLPRNIRRKKSLDLSEERAKTKKIPPLPTAKSKAEKAVSADEEDLLMKELAEQNLTLRKSLSSRGLRRGETNDKDEIISQLKRECETLRLENEELRISLAIERAKRVGSK